MFRRAMRLAACVLPIAGLATANGRAQDGQKPAVERPIAAAPGETAEELSALAPEHEWFKRFVGEWDVRLKLFGESPDRPRVSSGVSTFKLLMGGRYRWQDFKCRMQGEAYEGIGICGYDKSKRKYVSVWMNNMRTGSMHAEGELDKTARTFTEIGESSTPRGKMKFKVVSDHAEKDKFVVTTYVLLPDGNEAKAMEITYRRKKDR